MKEFRLPVFLVLAALAVISLNACAQNKTASGTDVFPGLVEQPLPEMTNFSGSYLSGRFAQRRQDWNAAQTYMNSVLLGDNRNPDLRERTFLLTVGAGNYAKAHDLAESIIADDARNEIGLTFLASEALERNDTVTAAKLIARMPDDGFGAYIKPLFTAWTLAGAGSRDAALKYLAANAAADDPTFQMHAGMIEEMAGNMPEAAKHYTGAMAGGLTLHSAVQVSDFFTRYGQPETADMIYTSLGKMYPFNPFISALSHQDKERIIPPNASRAADGAGVALYDLATMLYEKRAYDSAQIYASLARMMLPHSPFVMLMMGDIFALREQHAKAVDAYNSIPQDSPLYWLSRMRVAEVYEINGHLDMAVSLLDGLTKSTPTRINALVTLGDLYRRHDDNARAVSAYDAALKDIGTPTPDQWQIVYARGMALEKLHNWPLAEKDLLQALAFQPDNPQILNFIGYSWADKGLNMDKALDFIRRAVTLKPDDGYILDSYGWAFYRMGQYENAVKWMEQAVSQVPDDATILDHLGDAYWQVGRRNEARFKWQRAEEISTDKVFRTAIDQKIHAGLPSSAPARHGEKEAKL